MDTMEPDPFTQCLIESVGEGVAMNVLAEFHRGEVVKQTLAKVRQERVAAANQRIEHVVSETVGQHIMDIDTVAYHYWGQRLGYECWGDPQFRKEYMRDNPEVRVKTNFKARGTGWTPTPPPPPAKQPLVVLA